jgi:RNA recognition motif-containing protein
MNIYIGNLAREASEEEVRQAFEAFGQVASINIIKDKFTGESRGFAFIEMPSKEQGQAAITGMNGKELKGRTLTVNEAKPRTEGSDNRRGGSGGRRSFGGGGGGGRRFR